MSENEAAKARRRKGAKASTHETDDTRKLNVHVATNVYVRLVTHAAKARKTRGAVVEEAIAAYLAAERSGRREAGPGEDDPTG